MALRVFIVAPSALVTDHLPHGDGLVALGFVRELASRGHELHVAAGMVAVDRDLPPNVQLHPLAQKDVPAPIGRLRYMWHVRRLYGRLARSGRFDLVHQLNPVEVGVSLALVGRDAPVVLGPYVPDWAPSGPGADAPVGPAARRVKRLLRVAEQRRATTLLVSTPAAASKVEQSSATSAQVHELPPGIEARVWRPAPNGAPGQSVLFLANLEVRKGIHVLLDAFEAIGPDLPGARLRVAGVGPESDSVRRRIRESPALGRVELLGRVERDGALHAMQACDVYCLPSYGEPFGMTALEAMACARPVVATAAGGLQHLVPEAGGRKVPPGDAPALAAALAEVLGDAELRLAMGAHNRTIVEQRYAWPRVVDRLEDAYDDAIRRWNAGRPSRGGGSRRPAPGRR